MEKKILKTPFYSKFQLLIAGYSESWQYFSYRAVIPIVWKSLSFLFGTLDEEDLSRDNVRQLANDQQQIKPVLAESIAFVNDNQKKRIWQSQENKRNYC